MAQADISHFEHFPMIQRINFKDRVRNAVAKVIYGYDSVYEIPPPDGVTARTFNLDEDSHTDSPSGTEVMVDIDFEEWPRTAEGLLIPPEERSGQLLKVGYDIGELLMGGVMNEPGKEVFVWPRQMPASGWYDGSGYDEALTTLRKHFAPTKS